ncbi:CDP-alcohol phosphatidyltransferase family protein [Porphyrobacter sp. HT-58-2]|uniref:CDP-alcohol phosphatidyltransferase family protein n=1 Tax=Porphyrobacter sp. HT-58-2 TaxID=2023229 RepID=UPI001559E6E8|nr:CDP-alcohol phosphatidyltransferase family protein [Porphyrobacter sp. HT-58-2]
MTQSCAFHFASTGTANRLVAGVPAAARLARAYAIACPDAPLVLAIGWDRRKGDSEAGALTARTCAEVARLAPGLQVIVADHLPEGAIPAETLPDPVMIAALPTTGAVLRLTDPEAALEAASRAIIRATAKPGDGLISRHINRPVSQAISAQLLRIGGVRPGHATALTALTALAMVFCLLAFPTPAGLAAGAVLFQLASVLDGVDGEIARATYRTSRLGASLDSLIDAFTNCGFLAGAGASFTMQGELRIATICWAAAVLQVAGLTILGKRAWLLERVVHFDGAKPVVASVPGGVGGLIKDLTSRDFYCFAFMLASLCGLLPYAMIVFLVGSAVWLAFVIAAVARRSAPTC